MPTYVTLTDPFLWPALYPTASFQKVFYFGCQVIAEGCAGALLSGPKETYSIVFIWENWSMTCWLIDEGWDTTLALAVLELDSCCVVSEEMLVSVLCVYIDPHEMSWIGAKLALVPICGNLNPEDFLTCCNHLLGFLSCLVLLCFWLVLLWQNCIFLFIALIHLT